MEKKYIYSGDVTEYMKECGIITSLIKIKRVGKSRKLVYLSEKIQVNNRLRKKWKQPLFA